MKLHDVVMTPHFAASIMNLHCLPRFYKRDTRLIWWVTVNPEIFARILFSRYVLKVIFATPKNRD